MNPTYPTTAQLLYLDLMKGVLTRTTVCEKYTSLTAHERPTKTIYRALLPMMQKVLKSKGLEIVRLYRCDPEKRAIGLDWPPEAETMVGLKRLDNVQQCVMDVVASGVEGDVLETGVWRGGCSIFIKSVLAACGDTERTVWVADSFEGLPKPNAAEFPQDHDDNHWTHSNLAVSLEEVQENFRRYGLLDERVKFLKGWFKDTMPAAPIKQLAILRLDGDMYESTIQVLEAMYDKVSVGGYVIVDDYGLKGCKAAIDDFRRERGIADPIMDLDGSCVYWRRAAKAFEMAAPARKPVQKYDVVLQSERKA
jgi:O-methyltransferase